uniref:Chromosome partition protein Smc n=1 Tax=Aurantimonas coralicida TaxID=182270 RepID=A0A0P0YYY9_9HYPH|nr:chromosome partition protein Smc [Aurantimonas coralicida]
MQAALTRFLSPRATGAEQIGFEVATRRLKAPGSRSANIERGFARRRTSL